MTISEIKKASGNLNRKHYLKSSSLALIIIVPMLIFSALPYIIVEANRFMKLNIQALIFVLIIILFGFSVVMSSYNIGEKAWYTGRMNKSMLGIRRLLFWFKPMYSIKAFLLKAELLFLRCSSLIFFSIPSLLILSVNLFLAFTGGIEVWIFVSLLSGSAVLLIIGSVFAFIVNQRYFLAEYLYANNPKLKINQAIKQSRNLLDGHLFRIIKFKLSFLPLLLSGILIFPLFFIVPHYKLSCCILAKELCIWYNCQKTQEDDYIWRIWTNGQQKRRLS